MACNLSIVSHACFSLEDSCAKLIVDPWFFGSVFNYGWRLKNEVEYQALGLGSVSHVHITHEHPDHFHIPTLRLLNDLWDPVFILQETADKRVSRFIQKVLGKRVIELRDGEKFSLSRDMSMQVFSHGHMDSFSLINVNGYKILNINDCVLKARSALVNVSRRISYSKIDVLMSQYSFASYQGGVDDVSSLKSAASQHIEWIKMRNDFFEPTVFVPFASGVTWSHPENDYLNNFSV